MSVLIGEIGPTNGLMVWKTGSLLLFDDTLVHTRNTHWSDEACVADTGSGHEGDVWDPTRLAGLDDGTWIVPMESIADVLMQRRVQWGWVLASLGIGLLWPIQRCLTISHACGKNYVFWYTTNTASGKNAVDKDTTELLSSALGDRFVFDRTRYFGRRPGANAVAASGKRQRADLRRLGDQRGLATVLLLVMIVVFITILSIPPAHDDPPCGGSNIAVAVGGAQGTYANEPGTGGCRAAAIVDVSGATLLLSPFVLLFVLAVIGRRRQRAEDSDRLHESLSHLAMPTAPPTPPTEPSADDNRSDE